MCRYIKEQQEKWTGRSGQIQEKRTGKKKKDEKRQQTKNQEKIEGIRKRIEENRMVKSVKKTKRILEMNRWKEMKGNKKKCERK